MLIEQTTDSCAWIIFHGGVSPHVRASGWIIICADMKQMLQPFQDSDSTTLGPQSPPLGRVLPFPKQGCGRCGSGTGSSAATGHHPGITKQRTQAPYAGFSFLPKALRCWREHQGLKISAAAQGLGVAASTWGHWETGLRFPTGSVLLDLVQYTGLSLVELVCEHAEHCPL